jgi:hypothetical protein
MPSSCITSTCSIAARLLGLLAGTAVAMTSPWQVALTGLGGAAGATVVGGVGRGDVGGRGGLAGGGGGGAGFEDTGCVLAESVRHSSCPI